MSISGIIAKDISQDCEEEKQIVQDLRPSTASRTTSAVNNSGQQKEDIDG